VVRRAARAAAIDRKMSRGQHGNEEAKQPWLVRPVVTAPIPGIALSVAATAKLKPMPRKQ